jgi:DNA polymerase III alpha subunit
VINGHFSSLENFTERVVISIEQLRLLIRAGTFAFTGKGKKELLWQAHALIQPTAKSMENTLFKIMQKKFDLPILIDSKFDEAFDEMELMGFTLSSPFNLLRNKITLPLTAKEIKNRINQTVTTVGYLVNTKSTQTSKGERMLFGTFVDVEGHWIDTVHFPDSARRFPFTGNGCYTITGKVTEEYDFISIAVEEMKRLPLIDRENMTEYVK